jgi:hypothetical protein
MTAIVGRFSGRRQEPRLSSALLLPLRHGIRHLAGHRDRAGFGQFRGYLRPPNRQMKAFGAAK